MAGLAVWALVVRSAGSSEVFGHAVFHLAFAAVLAGAVWSIRRPLSAANRWLWRGIWSLSGAQTLEALGAFGYDNAGNEAIPSLRFVHNAVAPGVLLTSFLVVLVAGIVLLATRLPKPAGQIVAGLIGVVALFFLKTMVGF